MYISPVADYEDNSLSAVKLSCILEDIDVSGKLNKSIRYCILIELI